METNKPMTAEEYMKYTSDANGWGKHSPFIGGYDIPTWMEMYHKHMSQSAQQQPQGSELPSAESIPLSEVESFTKWLEEYSSYGYFDKNWINWNDDPVGKREILFKEVWESYQQFKSKQKGETNE